MARLDTGWHANPKVLQAGAQGMALHAWSISYCDDARSDGFIPAKAWPAFLNAGVGALVRLSLWEPVEGGYHLHDYAKYNRSRAEIEAREEGWRERQSRHRSRVTNGVTTTVTTGVTLARAAVPGPGPGDEVSSGTPKPPRVDAAAQGAPPTAATPVEPPPKWEEVAPGQHRGTPNGQGEVTLLKARCPRCERSLPLDQLEGHELECELVPGVPVHPGPVRPGNLGGFLPRRRRSTIPPEVAAELEHMASHPPTPEQIAAEMARLGPRQ